MITEKYKGISKICREALSEWRTSLYSIIQRDADGAYQVLSNPISRAVPELLIS